MKKILLKKDEIQNMVAGKNLGSPHLVQVFDIKVSETNGKARMSFKLSDGIYYIRSVLAGSANIKDYDVVEVKGFKTTTIKGSTVMIVEKLEPLFTGIDSIIGAPVDHQTKNPNANEISTALPATARPLKVGPSTLNQGPTSTVNQAALEKSGEISSDSSNMDKGVMPLKVLGLYSTDWVIKVRLLKKGGLKKYGKNNESSLASLEFADCEGTLISAALFKAEGSENYKNIEEGKCYKITKGRTVPANKKYTSINNDCSLALDDKTSIIPVDNDTNIPTVGYCFINLSKIQELQKDVNIDVAGIITKIGEIRNFTRNDGSTSTCKTLTLVDESNFSIDVTLWDELTEIPLNEEDIVAIKPVKVTEYRGKQLSTTRDTRITVEPDHPKIEALRKIKFEGVDGKVVSLSHKQEFKEQFALVAELTKTATILSTDSKGVYSNISGTIIYIPSERSFYYIGCSKCKKKLQEDSTCENCKKGGSPVPYYMFSMKISDGTDSVWVLVFGSTGEQILGKTAAELLELKEKNFSEFQQVFESKKGMVHFLFH